MKHVYPESYRRGFAHIILIAVLAATLAIFGLVYFKSLQKTQYTNLGQITQPTTKQNTDKAATKTPTKSGITNVEDQKLLPWPPEHITVRRDNGRVVVSWQGVEEDRAAKFKVYGRTGTDDEWQLLGSVDYRPGVDSFEFRTTVVTTQYTVSTISHYGGESQGETATIQ